MKKGKDNICLLTLESRTERGRSKGIRRDNNRTELVSEAIPALFLLIGILSMCRDMMYAPYCLAGAILAGTLVILILQVSEALPGASGIARMGIYVVSILCFLGFILYIAQGFLYTVNQIRTLWNLRFQTELERFSVNSAVVPGAMIFWSLLAVPLASLILMLVKRKGTGRLLGLVGCVLLIGFVLGQSQMWSAVACILMGIFGMMSFASAPKRQIGIRGILCIACAGCVFLAAVYITGEYKGLNQITRWKSGVSAWFERFRYGEDTLPKGDLTKAQDLLDGEEETLRLVMEKPQEWYLRGFVGGSYEDTAWKNLPAKAYQGEYEGLLKWLETKDFSVVTQFSRYQDLTDMNEGLDTGNVKVQVENIGAYRKFVYLPASVDSWTVRGTEAKKDWQVRSKRFFGADEYEFQAVDGAPSADGLSIAQWLMNPFGDREKTYLDAEAVYHSFAESYYMEIDDELKVLIESMFFQEEEEIDFNDFNDVTSHIRRTLRRETRYTEEPPAVPAGEDFVEWFLNDSKRGNAAHYASAAVLAYRTAGYAARYVEGYHYPSEQNQDMGEETRVTLTNKNAHAWAEVYVPGAGWMPVEVVPGMYTEMYTNQIIEGEPTFQVNSNPGEDGLEVEGSAGEEETSEKEDEQPLPLRRILSMIVFCMYLCLGMYLFLEIQRVIRRIIRKRSRQSKDGQEFVEWYADEIEKLLLLGKIKGDYGRPMEISAEVEEKIVGIRRAEYERAVQLLQKIRFGGKKLLPSEMHTLDCFLRKLARVLYTQGSAWKKIKMRYFFD